MKHKIKLYCKNMSGEGFHFFLKSKINKEKCWLLLDTGASNSVFDKTELIAHELKKSKNKKFTAVGVGTDKMEHDMVTLKKVEIGSFTIKKYETILLDLSIPNQHYQLLKLPKIHGIIGADILMKNEAEINIKKGFLILREK